MTLSLQPTPQRLDAVPLDLRAIRYVVKGVLS